MKKSSKALLASVLIVSSLGLVATVSAKQYSDRPDCERGGHHMGAGYKQGDKGFNVDRMARKLDLGDDQRTQIGAIMEASKQQMSDQRDKMQANREQLRSLTTQSPLDEAAVRAGPPPGGFYPDFADTSKKPDNGQKECLCQSEEDTAGSSSRVLLNSVRSRVSAVPRRPSSGPSRWSPLPPTISTNPSVSSAAIMRLIVDRGSSTALAISPRLRPAGWAPSS